MTLLPVSLPAAPSAHEVSNGAASTSRRRDGSAGERRDRTGDSDFNSTLDRAMRRAQQRPTRRLGGAHRPHRDDAERLGASSDEPADVSVARPGGALADRGERLVARVDRGRVHPAGSDHDRATPARVDSGRADPDRSGRARRDHRRPRRRGLRHRRLRHDRCPDRCPDRRPDRRPDRHRVDLDRRDAVDRWGPPGCRRRGCRRECSRRHPATRPVHRRAARHGRRRPRRRHRDGRQPTAPGSTAPTAVTGGAASATDDADGQPSAGDDGSSHRPGASARSLDGTAASGGDASAAALSEPPAAPGSAAGAAQGSTTSSPAAPPVAALSGPAPSQRGRVHLGPRGRGGCCTDPTRCRARRPGRPTRRDAAPQRADPEPDHPAPPGRARGDHRRGTPRRRRDPPAPRGRLLVDRRSTGVVAGRAPTRAGASGCRPGRPRPG